MKTLLVTLLLLGYSFALGAKPSIDTAAILLKIAKELKACRHIGYNYTMSASFPNGDKDKMTGRLFALNDDKLLLNDCDAYTLLYTGRWLYKANHREKSVTIVDLGTKANKAFRASTEKQLFENDMVNRFLDSAVLKLSFIKSYKRVGDTLTDISIVFRKGLLPQKLQILMNERSGIPQKYTLVVSQPTARIGGNACIQTTIQCTDFVSTIHKLDLEAATYFEWKNGKAILKKYTTYTINLEM